MDKIFQLQFIFMGQVWGGMKQIWKDSQLKHKSWKNGSLTMFSLGTFEIFHTFIWKKRKARRKEQRDRQSSFITFQ